MTPTNNEKSLETKVKNIISNNLGKRAEELNFQKKGIVKQPIKIEKIEKIEKNGLRFEGKLENFGKNDISLTKKDKLMNDNFLLKSNENFSKSKDFKKKEILKTNDNLKINKDISNKSKEKNNENIVKNNNELVYNNEKSNKISENLNKYYEKSSRYQDSNKNNEHLRKSSENLSKNVKLDNYMKNEVKTSSKYEEVLLKLSPKINLKDNSDKSKDLIEKVKELSKENLKKSKKEPNVLLNNLFNKKNDSNLQNSQISKEIIKENLKNIKEKIESLKKSTSGVGLHTDAPQSSHRSDLNKEKNSKKNDNNFKNLEGLMKLDIALKDCKVTEKPGGKYLHTNTSNLSKNSNSRQEKKCVKTDRFNEKKRLEKANSNRQPSAHSQNYSEYKNIEQFLLSTNREQAKHNRFFSSNWTKEKRELIKDSKNSKPLFSMKTQNKPNYSKNNLANSKGLQNFEFVSTNSDLRKSFNNFNKKSEIKTENRATHKYTKSETKINYENLHNKQKFLEEEIAEKLNSVNKKITNSPPKNICNSHTMRENSKIFLTDNNLKKNLFKDNKINSNIISNNISKENKNDISNNNKLSRKDNPKVYEYNQNNFVNIFLNEKNEKNKVLEENNSNEKQINNIRKKKVFQDEQLDKSNPPRSDDNKRKKDFGKGEFIPQFSLEGSLAHNKMLNKLDIRFNILYK